MTSFIVRASPAFAPTMPSGLSCLMCLILFLWPLYPACAQSLQDVSEQEYKVATFIRLARDGDLEGVRKFLDEGMNVNAKNKSGNTALIEACGAGREEMINFLVDNGADSKAENNIRETAASKAIKNGQYDVLMLLRKKNVWAIDNQGIIDILRYADANFIAGVWPGFSQGDQKAILNSMHLACQSGKVEVIKFFLDNGADPNQHKGKPLQVCCSSQGASLEAVRLLLDRGANANLWENDSALHQAAVSNRPDVANLLLERGSDVNARNRHGRTPLLENLAQGQGQHSLDPVVKILLAKGASANDKDNDGVSALMYAAFTGRIAAVQMLLDKGAEINYRTPKGGSPLNAALKGGSKEVVALMKKRGARQ